MHPFRKHQDNPNATNNHQKTPNAIKNCQDNLNAVKNRQDNPNAVRKQLTGLLWYYRQNCLICHLAKLPHLNQRSQLNHYHLTKLPHLNRDQHSIIIASPSSRILIGTTTQSLQPRQAPASQSETTFQPLLP